MLGSSKGDIALRPIPIVRAALLAILAVAFQATPAHATFPGQNGSLVSSSPTSDPFFYCLELINPSTGAQTQPGTCSGFGSYRISPDGTRVVSPFVNRPSSYIVDTRIQNLDGTSPITFPGIDEIGAIDSWSPDGRYISIVDILAD